MWDIPKMLRGKGEFDRLHLVLLRDLGSFPESELLSQFDGRKLQRESASLNNDLSLYNLHFCSRAS
jgi:hypothetical protein